MAKQTGPKSKVKKIERSFWEKLTDPITDVVDYLFEQLNINIKDDSDGAGTINGIRSGIDLRGYNLWILAAAALLACIGLDTNSAAVIIGAMLISPLMNPILGVGLGLGIDDPDSLFKSIQNLAVAVFMSLLISFLYFRFLTPLGGITPEIQARTSPTLLDAFVALFGGVAGIVSNSRREKSNAIPGVAIATALMPPLCSAGFGLANMEWSVFFGAFYLFFINAMVISFFTFLIVRYLGFHEPMVKELADFELAQQNAERAQVIQHEEELIQRLESRERNEALRDNARKSKEQALIDLKEAKAELKSTRNEFERVRARNKIKRSQEIITEAKLKLKEDSSSYKLVKKLMPLLVIISILPSVWFLWNLIQERRIENRVQETIETTLGEGYDIKDLTIDADQSSVSILVNSKDAIDDGKKAELDKKMQVEGFEKVSINRVNLSEEEIINMNSQVTENFYNLQSEVEKLKAEIRVLKKELNPEASPNEIESSESTEISRDNESKQEDSEEEGNQPNILN